MREVFDEDELPPVMRPRDTEVTLGPMAVSGLIFALLLLCGLCFGLGYSMGSRGSKSALKAVQTPAAPAADASAGATSKPGAVTPKISTAQPAATAAAQTEAGATPAAVGQFSESSPGQPASAPLSPLMVQIAVVSHQDDADALVSALHKRGYAVSLSQDATDNQFHVRVGPFASLNEANTIRQKLLNDGYNAVVQP
jgi:cell division septation protein DedD